jgi:hypothetical protein
VKMDVLPMEYDPASRWPLAKRTVGKATAAPVMNLA